MRVLIVDDDPLIAEMYTLKLTEAGHRVETVADGRKAVEKITGGGFDVVLLDVVLPLMDGFEVLDELKRQSGTHPPVILLTNLGQKEDVERGKALGAVDYIIKANFTPSEVVEKIATVTRAATSAKP